MKRKTAKEILAESFREVAGQLIMSTEEVLKAERWLIEHSF